MLPQANIGNGFQPPQNINEISDIAESLKQLNDDTLEQESRMSGIDLRTRLTGIEIPSILACDTLVAFHLLPTECLGFTRQKKRLAVSLNGEGRNEIVKITVGKQEQDETKGFKDKLKGWFGK